MFIQFCDSSGFGQCSERWGSFSFVASLGADSVQKRCVHSVLWFLWIRSTLRAAGGIQFCGPFGVGQRSGKGCSFSVMAPLDSVNLQSSGGHSLLCSLGSNSLSVRVLYCFLWPLSGLSDPKWVERTCLDYVVHKTLCLLRV